MNIFFKLILIISLIVAGQKWYEGRPVPKGVHEGEIIVSNAPFQLQSRQRSFLYPAEEQTYTLKPLAFYRLSGIVVVKTNLFTGKDERIGPVDVGMIWGDIATNDFDKYITFRSSSNWLIPELAIKNTKYPFVMGYIAKHASHTHVIPSNKNVLNTVNSLKKKDKAILEGYLVEVTAKDGYRWTSSLTRDDWGEHSCEVMYVNKVIINNKVYY